MGNATIASAARYVMKRKSYAGPVPPPRTAAVAGYYYYYDYYCSVECAIIIMNQWTSRTAATIATSCAIDSR